MAAAKHHCFQGKSRKAIAVVFAEKAKRSHRHALENASTFIDIGAIDNGVAMI